MLSKEKLINLLINIKNTRIGEKRKFERIAYDKVIKQLESYEGPFELNEVLKFPGVGKKIGSLIKEFFETGNIEEAVESEDKNIILQNFQKIHGVGPTKAEEWYSKGYRSFEDISKVELTENQKVSIEYYEELNQRIPRLEIEYLELELFTYFKYINSINKSRIFGNIAGSYRRGYEDSGDIDVIVCINDTSLRTYIENFPYFVKIMYNGEKKITGIIKIPQIKYKNVMIGGIHRQIDFEIVNNFSMYYFAELYFTGSKEHNIMMRSKAAEQGKRLNEKELIDLKDSTTFYVNNEKDIYDYLNLDYLEPYQRNNKNLEIYKINYEKSLEHYKKYKDLSYENMKYLINF